MDPEQLRRATNEARFREVNERIAELETGFSGYGEQGALLVGFVCECGNEDCGETFDVTQAQYESVHRFYAIEEGEAEVIGDAA